MKKIISINYPVFTIVEEEKVTEKIENPEYNRKFDLMENDGRHTDASIIKELEEDGIPEYIEVVKNKYNKIELDMENIESAEESDKFLSYINDAIISMNVDDLKNLLKNVNAPISFKRLIGDAIRIKHELKIARKALKGKTL